MRSLIVFVALVGCHETAPADVDAPVKPVDSSTGRCSSDGSGIVTGSVLGAEVAPVQTVKVSRYAGVPTIVLAETVGPNLCVGPMPADGDYLSIFVCTKAIGDYPLSGYVPPCPGSTGGAVFAASSGGGTVLSRATSGMLAIDSVDATCMTGTFNITFDSGDSVTGSFNASVCP